MKVTEAMLIEQGAALIAARRHLWDLERMFGLRPWDTFLKQEIKLARKEYTKLLKERQAFAKQAQLGFDDVL